jgi:glucose/mannose transport system permease protein
MADIQHYSHDAGWKHTILRGLLYLVLILFAAYYLFPLFVMISTSLKSLDEIREGSLISLPRVITFDAWNYAWNEACVGLECSGIKIYFWNSVKMAVPAVLISTFLGAINGYALTKWRFKGANIVFALLLFGCFIPFQVVLLPMSQVLGSLGLASSTTGLVLVHVVYGLCFTTLFRSRMNW